MIIILFPYYFILLLGLIFVVVSVVFLILMYRQGDFIETWSVIKLFGALLLGILLLWTTIPSVKSVITKDFDVVSGKCTIEIYSSGRTSDSTFNMIDTDDQFTFNEIPPLDAYGKSIPYYCEVTVTKNHMWGIDYKIYDLDTRDLVYSSSGE